MTKLNAAQLAILKRFLLHEDTLFTGRNGEQYDRLARLQVRGFVIMVSRGTQSCEWRLTAAGRAALQEANKCE